MSLAKSTISASRIVAAILSLLLVFLAPLATRAEAAAQESKSKSPDYVESSGFKNKIFELKHRDPRSVVQVLYGLGSGFKGATVAFNEEFRTVTVRDFPENLAVIEEAIKRLDTPETPRPTIEFHIHILIASNDEAVGAEYPAEINDAVKQLQLTLKYKSYQLMSSSVQRAKEGFSGVSNSGVAESRLLGVDTAPDRPILYSYTLQPVSVESAGGTNATVQIGAFDFGMRIPINVGGAFQYQNVGFKTPVNLRDGEKVVVGTTTMGNKGVAVILLARLVK